MNTHGLNFKFITDPNVINSKTTTFKFYNFVSQGTNKSFSVAGTNYLKNILIQATLREWWNICSEVVWKFYLMSIHVQTYKHMHANACMHTHIYTCTHHYIHVHMYEPLHICTHACTTTHIYRYHTHAHTHVHVHTHLPWIRKISLFVAGCILMCSSPISSKNFRQ